MKKKTAKKVVKRKPRPANEMDAFIAQLCFLLMDADIAFLEHWDDGVMVRIQNLSRIKLRELAMQLNFLANVGEAHIQKTKGE